MLRSAFIFRLALLAGAAPPLTSAFGAWDEMRSGMSRAEAAEAVGQPAIIGIGRGFETWSFEHGGEVLLYRGAVLYWTVPKIGAELAPLKKSGRPDATGAKDRSAAGAVTRPSPSIPHAAHNCPRSDCPIHSPATPPARK